MRELRLISVPYHDGREGVDRGRGPARLLDSASFPRSIRVETVRSVDAAAPEAARVFEIARRIAALVRAAIAEGAFPLVLAGDCNSCLGTVAGCGTQGLGVAWFDAHADFDTPEDSLSGSLDAMGLATLTGRCWEALRKTIPGFMPIDEGDVVLVAVRDLEPGQRERLRRSRIRSLEGNGFTATELRRALEDLRGRAERLYLHIDLDSLDPGEGVANQYSAPGGLSTEALVASVEDIFGRFDVAAAAVTAYNPDSDTGGRMAANAARVLAALAEIARSKVAVCSD